MTARISSGMILIAVLSVAVLIPQIVGSQMVEGAAVGKVTDEDGRVIKNIGLMVFAYREGQWLEGEFNKNSGEYSIKLPQGEWFIGADTNPESGFTGSGINLPIAVSSGETAVKNIKLKRLAGIISGKILKPDGGILPKALIHLVNSSSVFFSTEADAGGRYRFLVPAGKYSVRAFFSPKTGVINPESKELTIKNGQLANLSLVFKSPDRKISGKVYLGGLLSEAFIWAWSDKGGYNETRADSKGNYELKVKADEKWHLKAVREIGRFPYESKEQVVSVGKIDLKLDLDLAFSGFALPESKAEKFILDNTKSASLKLLNGMRLSLPPGAVEANELTISIKPFIGPNQKSINVVGPAYRIELYGPGQTSISALKKSGVLEIPYSEADLKKANSKRANLKVFFWDEDASAWRSNGNSVVVEKDNFVLGLVDHFSEFIVADPEPEPASEPSGGGGGGGGAVSPPALLKPTPPSIVNASADPGSVKLDWFDFVITAGEKYKIERRKETDSSFIVIAENIQESPFLDTRDLEPGTFYFYRIISVNNVGESSPSLEAAVRTPLPKPPPPDRQAPVMSEVDTSFAEADEQVTVRITFTTNEPAISEITCSVAADEKFALGTDNLLSVHQYRNSVEPDALYNCGVTTKDAALNTGEKQFSFTAPSLKKSPTPPPPSLTRQLRPAQIAFTRNLTLGSVGQDVLALQRFLNDNNFPVAAFGPGSPGNETTYFGNLTKQALIFLQNAFTKEILTPVALISGTGYFGPSTIGFVNSLRP